MFHKRPIHSPYVKCRDVNSFNGINHIQGLLRIGFALFQTDINAHRITFLHVYLKFYQKRFSLPCMFGDVEREKII